MKKSKQILIFVSVFLVCIMAVSIFSHIPHIKAYFLVKAIKSEEYEKIEKLLDSGIDPNIITTSVVTEAMLNAVESGGERPLAVACSVGNFKIVKLLIEYGATAEPFDTDGWSPLNETLFFYQPDDMAIVELLLKNGADINELDAYDTLPIFYAAEMLPKKYYGEKNGRVQFDEDYNEEVAQGITDIVIFLLEYGNYDINIKSAYNDSTLLIAEAKSGNKCLVEYLLSKGCDASVKDNANKTALDYASKYNHLEIIELLKG